MKELVEREHEGRYGWIVYRGGQPAGFADLDLKGDTELGYLSVYVCRDLRNAGVGTVALRRILQEAQSLGLAGVVAHTQADNEAALRCLEKAGFSQLDEYGLDNLRHGRDLRFILRFTAAGNSRSAMEETQNGYA